MLRSLYSGVSGMKSNQTKMDVIANNIANVGTTAFKSGRVRFQDILSQTVQGASAPVQAGTNGLGGINPKQVGLGMQVAGIDTITNQGSPQPTGRPLDCAIDGDGYFIVSNDGTDGNVVYSRDGAFGFDANFNIVNSNGQKLLGYALDPATGKLPADLSTAKLQPLSIPEYKFHFDVDGNVVSDAAKINNYSINQDGTITAVYDDSTSMVLGRISLAKFPNPGGLLKLGNNSYTVSANSGDAAPTPAGEGGTGKVLQSTLEMSNVDLASEFTDMISTSRAFQANSRSITTSDEMLQELLNLKR
jgi:fagellar hook-basal body proteins